MTRILLVEDDVDAANEMKNMLQANKLQVECASTVAIARSCFSASTYDLIILDWNLPDGTGLQLLRELREQGAGVRALMLTRRTSIEDKNAGFVEGCDDYLAKPFHPVELLCRVQALLRRQPERRENNLRSGDIELNLVRKTVTKAGMILQLTRREFAVLEFFMLNPNRIFTPEELLRRIWNADDEATTQAVVVTILRLRKKIDTPGKATLIENRVNTGYVLPLQGTSDTP